MTVSKAVGRCARTPFYGPFLRIMFVRNIEGQVMSYSGTKNRILINVADIQGRHIPELLHVNSQRF